MSSMTIITEYTTPGGLATRTFSDGAATMRVCLGHIDNADDGLIAEMDSGREAMPWANLETKLAAIATIMRRTDLADDLRERLIQHIRRTPYFGT